MVASLALWNAVDAATCPAGKDTFPPPLKPPNRPAANYSNLAQRQMYGWPCQDLCGRMKPLSEPLMSWDTIDLKKKHATFLETCREEQLVGVGWSRSWLSSIFHSIIKRGEQELQTEG